MSEKEFDNFIEFKKKYKELINLVYKNSGEEKLNVYIENVSDEDLKLLINNYCKTIETDKKIRKLFLNRNERLFGENSKLKIIPSFNLKKCLLNSENSAYIWECIQILYAIYRSGDETKKELVTKIVERIEEYNLSNNNLNNKESSENVDDMIMDIADTLRNNLVKESKKSSKVNPIDNMIKTSKMISDRYGSKLRNGEISMNDMFSSLGRMMEKIDEKTSKDDELKNIDVSDMPKPEDLMKDLGLGNINEGENNPMDMLSSLMGNKNEVKKQKKLSPEQMKEMEEFYKNMDTTDLDNKSVEYGDNIEIVDESNIESPVQVPNIGDMLNGMGGSNEGMPNIGDMLNGMGGSNEGIPNIGDMLNGMGGSNEGMPNIGDMFNELGSDSNSSTDINERLDKINENLISRLPKDKQEEVKIMTENMTKIMNTVIKN